MSSAEQIIEKACQEKSIPNAVVVAADRTGHFQYSHAFGVRSLVSNEPIQTDATMWMASCTKLLTTIAAMQCVEKGLLNLDDDVSIILTELKDLPILTGFDEEDGGKPILIPNPKKITLRHLLTHSSGLSYDIFNPTVSRYQTYRGVEPAASGSGNGPIRKKYVFPLLFAPGEGWEYSVGVDWAGQLVERVNNNISLGEYLWIHVWEPLDINDMTFKPPTHALVQKNMTDMSWRQGDVNQYGSTLDPDGKLETTTQSFWAATSESDDCQGGGGVYGSMPSYHKIINSLLLSPCPLLEASTLDEMFRPQLSSASKAALSRVLGIPEMNIMYGSLGTEADPDWGLGGITNLRDLKSGRRAGSLAWGGYPGLSWWVDRTEGVAGIWGSQLCPPGDPKIAQLEALWEAEVYEKVRKAKDVKGKL